MVNYGQNKEFQITVENVDYYPEIAGVKISNLPIIAALSIVPLWFNHFGLAVFTLFGLIGFFYRAGRLEDEGRPIFLNASIVKASKILPGTARNMLLPAFTHIRTHKSRFRR